MSRFSKAQREENRLKAIGHLRDFFERNRPPRDKYDEVQLPKVYVAIANGSGSYLRLFVIGDHQGPYLNNITYEAAWAIGGVPRRNKHGQWCVVENAIGTSRSGEVVSQLGLILFGDYYALQCIDL